MQDTLADISQGCAPWATAAHWKKHSLYILSYRSKTAPGASGRLTMDKTLVWDYRNDTFWAWTNIDAQSWLEDEGGADEQRLYFLDINGGIYQFGVGLLDHGAAITRSVTTQRLGQDSYLWRVLREVSITSTNRTRSISVTPVVNDLTQTSGTITLTDASEDDWGTLVWSGSSSDNWATEQRRQRRIGFRHGHDFVQLTLSSSTKNQPFEISSVSIGLDIVGPR